MENYTSSPTGKVLLALPQPLFPSYPSAASEQSPSSCAHAQRLWQVLQALLQKYFKLAINRFA